jgi:hypothetical protein
MTQWMLIEMIKNKKNLKISILKNNYKMIMKRIKNYLNKDFLKILLIKMKIKIL